MSDRLRGLLARIVVRLAALGAPKRQRARLVREWEAELWHAVHGSARQAPGPGPLWHSLGVFADVRALRRLERNEGEERSMRSWLAGWYRELGGAARGLSRSSGFAAVAVFTLGLGMGGSAAIYTLLDRIVLDPLPYPESDRLVQLTNQVPGVGPDEVWNMSTAQYVYFSQHARSFDAIGLYRGLGANIQAPAGPQRAFGWQVTASMFPLLGAGVRLGRLIDVNDDRPDAPPVVVLSHGFWQRQFGEDREVIGRNIRINDYSFQVIGVMQPGVRAPGAPTGVAADLWIPMRIDPNGTFSNNHVYPGIARLAPNVDASAAEAELARLTSELPERFPRAYSQEFFDRYGFRTQATPLKEAVVGEMSRNLWILFGAVGLVVLIACANVANLFLVRMEGRRHELAVRSALGANRSEIGRHVLAEGLLLALGGGVLGLLAAFFALPALTSIAPEALPRVDVVRMDLETLLFTAGLTLAIGVGLAAYPLTRLGRSSDADVLAGTGRSRAVGPERQRARRLLVVAQVGLALTLVVGAGLLIESLRELHAVDPGLDPEGVLVTSLYLTPDRYESDVEIWAAYREILERVRALPGVTEAGMSSDIPVEGRFGCTVQGFEDPTVYERLEAAGMTTCAGQEPTTPGYFEAMRIPLLQGRTFTEADNDHPTRGAVVVSQAFAERFWPGEDPIGKGVAPSGRTIPPFYRVIGVVGDVPASSVVDDPAIAIYYPVVHNPETPGNWGWWRPTSMDLVVRTGLADPVDLYPEVRRAVLAVDPTAPLANARSMERIIADSMARFTFVSTLLAIAAAVALILAAVGLYGVVSHLVSRRTREIGVRIAVGAGPGDVERQFLKGSLVMVAVGLAVGAALTLAVTRVMEALLVGVEPTDPGVFAAAAALLAAVALLATWIPARRAARVDPVEALRVE